MTLWYHEPSSTLDRVEIIIKTDDGKVHTWHGDHFYNPDTLKEPDDNELDHTFDPPTAYWQKATL